MESRTTEEQDFAKMFWEMHHSSLLEIMQRIAHLADEFTRLEVQIATILFAFSGIFVGLFDESLLGFSPFGLLSLKFSFALVLFFLILSLAFGLIHIKRKEKFWEEMYGMNVVRYNKWRNVVQNKEISLKEGEAFHLGTVRDGGLTASTPDWTWILQTITLGIAVLLMFCIALVVIFAS